MWWWLWLWCVVLVDVVVVCGGAGAVKMYFSRAICHGRLVLIYFSDSIC